MRLKRCVSVVVGMIMMATAVVSPVLNAAQLDLRIGRYDFSQDAEVKRVAEGISLQDAVAITTDNGIDEIFFEDEQGNLYVAYGDRLSLSRMQNGFIGIYNGKRVRVVHFEDERNTFSQGARGVFSDTGERLSKLMDDSVGQAITAAAGSIVGALTAATMFKGAAAAKAAAGAATGVGIGATAAAMIPILKGAAVVGAGIACIVGVAALCKGISASRTYRDYSTIDMITDQEFAFQDSRPVVGLDRIRSDLSRGGAESGVEEFGEFQSEVAEESDELLEVDEDAEESSPFTVQ